MARQLDKHEKDELAIMLSRTSIDTVLIAIADQAMGLAGMAPLGSNLWDFLSSYSSRLRSLVDKQAEEFKPRDRH